MDVLDSVLEYLLDGFSFLLDTILDYTYDIFFNTLGPTFSHFGSMILSFFSSKFLNCPPSLDFLPFYIGFIFVLFVFERVFGLLR